MNAKVASFISEASAISATGIRVIANAERPTIWRDDLDRHAYCLLGIPIDATTISEAVQLIHTATRNSRVFFVSTPNLNFVAQSYVDASFRETLLRSDFCPIDSFWLVWLGRVMGFNLKERVAGSDVFDALKVQTPGTGRLRVFLFGGQEGLAVAAARSLNTSPGVECVGHMFPGYGAVDDMSGPETIAKINQSNADFLVVALGAAKGQAWLHKNASKLTIPVRAHLGAAMGFEAKTIRRAPPVVRKCGFEWLWRIKEEPSLWRRYARDAKLIGRLLGSRGFDLAVDIFRNRLFPGKSGSMEVTVATKADYVTVQMSGPAVAANIADVIYGFRHALRSDKSLMVLDLASTSTIDARFLGALLMVRKILHESGRRLELTGIRPAVARQFRLHCVDYLLS